MKIKIILLAAFGVILLGSLTAYAQDNPYVEVFTLEGNLLEPIPADSIFTANTMKQLTRPSYQVFQDNETGERIGFSIFTLLQTSQTRRGVPRKFTLSFEEYPLPESMGIDQEPQHFTLTQENKQIRVTGTDSSSISLLIDPYNLSNSVKKMVSYGQVETSQLPTGETLYIYKTPWLAAYQKFQNQIIVKIKTRDTKNRMIWRKFYDYIHNGFNYQGLKNLAQSGNQYNDCIASDDKRLFCFKKEGNFFVIGSKQELGKKVTFWIDQSEDYKR